MLNLCLHCGARHVERHAVEQAATPAASKTWVPVPHHRLLEQVESTLTTGGLEIVSEAHALWNNGDRYFGLRGDMDQAITIRTLVLQGDRYSYQAGAGIVSDSVPDAEHAEIIAKGAALLRALELAEAGL